VKRCNRFSTKGDKLDIDITNSWHWRVLPVFQFILKIVDPDIQNYNIAFVSYGCETWSVTLGGGTEAKGLQEYGAEEDIWALRCVSPVVCVTNEREENVVKQHT